LLDCWIDLRSARSEPYFIGRTVIVNPCSFLSQRRESFDLNQATVVATPAEDIVSIDRRKPDRQEHHHIMAASRSILTSSGMMDLCPYAMNHGFFEVRLFGFDCRISVLISNTNLFQYDPLDVIFRCF
jgi:hypothetical protein